MICPKVCAIESQGATWKRDSSEIFDFRLLLPRIETGDAPILVPLLRPAQEIDRPMDEDMAADLGAYVKNPEDVSLRIELEDAMLVPLTQVEMVAIVTEV